MPAIDSARTLSACTRLTTVACTALHVCVPQVRDRAVQLMPWTTLYSVLATLAPGWSQQTLFGIGAPLRLPAAINFACFFGVGLPLGAWLAFPGGFEERGLWMGLVAAMGLIIAGQYTYIFCTVNWAQAAERARERALKRDADGAAAAESDGRGLAAADSAAAAVEM